MPELVRPDPDGRHRPQGIAGHRADGRQTEGFQIHLGGSLAGGDGEARIGRKIRGPKTTADDLPDYLERVCGASRRARPGETFAALASRASEEDFA